ncbi:hypothetical protein HMPREF0733_11116 [Rothia dentocariosa ATCC 17931]|uniref:Uncharacterized protein n=1 Tax=Rothia dentocariosa (strain ATCC 17931 / CDC X599 / XDIA) TaxID=762948 RepID=E3H470_ROTDC|nr:hypothetical protein HMPREF0733_11116 [Rothia dentocariosa ATCC 17931]
MRDTRQNFTHRHGQGFIPVSEYKNMLSIPSQPEEPRAYS